jgi:hypothetical protein
MIGIATLLKDQMDLWVTCGRGAGLCRILSSMILGSLRYIKTGLLWFWIGNHAKYKRLIGTWISIRFGRRKYLRCEFG